MADASNSWVSVLKPRADMRSDMDFQCKTSITTLLLYSNKYFSNNFWNFMKFLKKIEIFEILKKKIWNFWNLMTFFESFEILWYQGRYGKCHVIIYKYSRVVAICTFNLCALLLWNKCTLIFLNEREASSPQLLWNPWMD
jgi:hypothetical protein